MLKILTLISALALSNAEWDKTLRIRLFPYIPNYNQDFSPLQSFIKKRFDETHPDADFTLDVEYSFGFDSYKPDAVKAAMSDLNGNGSTGVHVAEIDLIDLQEILDHGVLGPAPATTQNCCQNPSSCEWFDMSCDASTVDNVVYGTPTWICSNFIHNVLYGEHSLCPLDPLPSTGQELAQRLIQCRPSVVGPGDVALIAQMVGSWTTGALYMQAYADTHGYDRVHEVLEKDHQVDQEALDGLTDLASTCMQHDGSYPCIEGAYEWNTVDELTINHKGLATLAYYEPRSNWIVANNDDQTTYPKVQHAPIGSGHNPLFFQDALVISKACSDDSKCREAGETFVSFLSGVVLDEIALGTDQPAKHPASPPRYLLPSKPAFFQSAPDKHYKAFGDWFATTESQIFPTGGFVGVRTDLQQKVLTAIKANLGVIAQHNEL